ncbi:hypothetical protein TKK_0009681 [Trichogramma kaykai]|uniref:Luciferin 4-monooxygenase n=1 Tax=Trichogramma kaykai TaxID=54128 RepID=A0ABD2X0Q4_9HYME
MKSEKNILHGPEFVFEFPRDMSLGQFMYDQLISHENAIAQVQKETNVKLTYDQILNKSCRLAQYFRNQNVQVNDRIAICAENNLGWAVPLCTSLFIGTTLCPLNPMYSKREFLHALNISKPKYIFVSPIVADTLLEISKELSWKPTLILMLDHPRRDILNVEKVIAGLADVEIEDFKVTKVDPEEHVVTILCSSGTTGLAKGVMLSDRNYLVLMQTLLDGSGLANKDDVMICLLPFFHSYCFSVLLMGIIAGSTSIVFSMFKEKLFLETIQEYRIKILTMVPPLMVFLAKHPMVDNYDLSSVKLIWCGAAPLSSDVENAVKKRLNNPEIRQGYGMTETTLSVLKLPENCKKPGSAGVLLAGCSAKVVAVNESGESSNEALGPHCRGELCFKGGLIMKGYCGDHTSTSATIDKDGWLHSGDIGYYDEEGFFYIVDRLKELIKYKGFQVPPAELEAILLTNPKIKDAAVVGLPDEEAGELPLAFVVKNPQTDISADEIIKYVNERVSNQKKLRGGVKFLDSIPKNPSGKILRRELRNLIKSKL